MSGIRVSGLPESSRLERLKKSLQLYFGRECNGGGKIQDIFYPVLGNEAVIIFEDPAVVDTVVTKQHVLEDAYQLILKRLPQKHIFLSVTTELDPDIASILQASEDNMDKIKHGLGIDVQYDDSEMRVVGLSGSWYQIEMAWQFIDDLMIEQKQLQGGVQVKLASIRRMQSHKDDDMDIEEDGITVVADHREGFLRQASGNRSDRILSDQMLSDFKSINNWRDTSPHTDSDEDEDNGKRRLTAARQRELSSSHTVSQITKQSAEDFRSKKKYYNDTVDDKLLQTFDRDTNEMNGRERSMSPQQEVGYGYVDGSMRERERFRARVSSDNHVSRLPRGAAPLSPLSDNSFVLERDVRRLRQSLSLDVGTNYGDDDRTSYHFSSLDSERDVDRHVKTRLADRLTLKEGGRERDNTNRTAKFGQSSSTEDFFSTSRDYQRENLYTDLALMHHQKHDEGISSTLQTYVPKHDTVPAECQDENLKFHFCVGRIHVTVLCGDILKERSSGIVNAANGSLLHAAGVAGAISRAAGPEMESECDKFIIKHGTLKTTEVMHTSAGGRLSREVTHILHAVGPIWIGESLKDTFHYELTKTFMNCFVYANDRILLESLTVPLISSGIFGAPLDECVRCFLDGLLVYAEQGTKTTHLKKVHLIFKDPDSTMLCIAILQQLLDSGMENLTKEALEMYTAQEIRKTERARHLDSFQYRYTRT
ncbi:hypothetical protein ACJMK2_006615 [Sinanodonta woodiana]|uniref:Macro domain-containing protein n=1 Tax=Sinanodonta woodiana TaxID=1069815 RepID=A0ABD3VUF9_SINWO